jgi:transposase
LKNNRFGYNKEEMKRGKYFEQTIIGRLEKENEKLRATIKELESVIKELKSTIKEKDKRIKELGDKLEDKELQRKQLLSYLYKANGGTKEGKKLGKKEGAKGYQRPKPRDEEVTEQEVYSLRRCPHCHNEVGKAVDEVIKYEEDINIRPQKIIKKYTITRHWCPRCEEFVKASGIPEIRRIGLNVMAYILYARYRLRLPINRIKQSLKDLHDFRISEGEVVGQLEEARELFSRDYELITELIKGAESVYCDETGWRVKGHNWWIWVFSTEQGTRYLIEESRGKGVAERALGEKKDRVIISDFYGAYKNLPGRKQKCWVHLLRDTKEVSGQMHKDLKEVYEELTKEIEKKKEERESKRIEDKLVTIERRDYKEEKAKGLQERISEYRRELLTCLRYDNVMPHNNTAERALRGQVVMRKIFGGSRSVNGAKVHEVNSTVIESKLKANPNFFDVFVPLIRERLSQSRE